MAVKKLQLYQAKSMPDRFYRPIVMNEDGLWSIELFDKEKGNKMLKYLGMGRAKTESLETHCEKVDGKKYKTDTGNEVD